jgi:ectoine hydroxylase-related dioxygenase (phytanoyl-CoA dioxygenase family)
LSTTSDENVGLEQEISTEYVPDNEPVDIILKPGMMSFHHPYVLHGAEPNNSGTRRGGLTFRYMPSSSYYDREIEARQGRQGVAFNADRQLHLIRGVDVCGRNDIYRARD